MRHDQKTFDEFRVSVLRTTQARPPSRSIVSTGYLPRRRSFHRAYNFTIALTLLALTLPLFALISAGLFVTQGRQIFYRGTRAGKGGRTFKIVKFRTLDGEKACQLTKDCVLPANSGIETPMGAFLRESRLDELPQLFNVLVGDMNMAGPRPVRPEIAAQHRNKIPNYDTRFLVKPGLIGLTQAYLSHGASKAIRARYNNHLCRTPVHYLREIGMAFTVGSCIVARVGRMLFRRFIGHAAEDRLSARAAELDVQFFSATAERLRATRIDAEVVTLARPLPQAASRIGWLVITLPDGQRRRATIALEEYMGAVPPSQAAYCYRAQSDLANHVLSRYLFQAVVVPHRSHFLLARLRRLLRRHAPSLPSIFSDSSNAIVPKKG